MENSYLLTNQKGWWHTQDPILRKCEDCGFLAMRHKPTRELREAERDEKGQLNMAFDSAHPQYPYMDSEIYERTPICIQGVRNFRKPDIYNPGTGTAAVDWSLVKEEWDSTACFTEHVHGLTPKEHLDMLNRQWMLEREDRRDEEMRSREDRRDEKVEHLQRDLHRREMVIMGGVVTFAIIAGSILGALIEAGWISKPW